MIRDARELGRHWVLFPLEMVEDLDEFFSDFLNDLRQAPCENEDDKKPLQASDLPISPDYFVDFDFAGRDGEDFFFLTFCWFSHAIEVAWRLEQTIPDESLVWQELANQCHEQEGDVEQSKAFADAIFAVKESLDRIKAWASVRDSRLKARVKTGSGLGLQLEERTVSRTGVAVSITLTENQATLLRALLKRKTSITGSSLATLLNTSVNALNQSISRLNDKLSRLKIEIRKYKICNM